MSDVNYKELRLTGKIFATGIMSFCGVVSETAMNVTFPTLMNEFGIGTSTVQWITTGYLLILSLVITMSSYLKRNFSTRQLFLIAITLFIVATALCYRSPAFWVLLCGRMLQGIGTGIALPLMFNIILAEAPKEKLGVFMGIGSLITAMAPAIGPVLGGYIVDEFGWRVIFLVLLFLLVPALLLGAWLIKHENTGDKSRFHLVEYVLICIGYSAFILATVRASADGWLSLSVLGLIALSAVSIWLFIRRSRTEKSPLLRFEVMRHPVFVLGLAVILAVQFCTLALGYVIPNYSQIVGGTTAFTSGLLLVPGCVVGAVLALVAGWILDRMGARKPILSGAVFLLLSLVLFSVFGTEMTTTLFYAFYIIYTIGQGLCVGNTMTYGLSKLPKDLSADGNALINSLQQLSGAAGTAVAATIVASSQSADMAHFAQQTATGSRDVFLLLAVILALSLLSAIRMFTTQIHTD